MENIIGKWIAKRKITCKNQLQIKVGEEFDVTQLFEGSNVKVLKGKYVGILGEDVLTSSARKK